MNEINLSTDVRIKLWKEFLTDRNIALSCSEKEIQCSWNNWLFQNYGFTIPDLYLFFYEGHIEIHDPYKYFLILKYI
jgi:hypothetical protein